jgi:hypothetical protein
MSAVFTQQLLAAIHGRSVEDVIAGRLSDDDVED